MQVADWQALDSAILAQMEQRHIPGASVAVVERGSVTYVRGYGQANLEWGIPAQPDTAFEIASVTKPFTATGVMLLATDGKLDLDDPITRYLPELPSAYASVVVRRLLSHTAGVIRDGMDGYWKAPPAIARDYSREEMLELIGAASLCFSPGDKYAYSNSGYFLLGLVIELLSGESYSDFMSRRLFGPLGMEDTRPATRRDLLPRRAAGYSWEEGAYRNAPYCGLTHHFSNGGLASTVLDLARWDAALSSDRLLPQMVWLEMWTPVCLNDGTEAVSGRDALGLGQPSHTGLGWGLSGYRGHRTVGHSGALPGYTSQFTRYPDDGVTIIVLCNNWAGEDGRNHAPTLARTVADHCVPDLAPLTPAELAALAYWEQDFPEAARRYVDLLDGGEANPEAAYNAARCFARAGDAGEAFVYLRRARDQGMTDGSRAAEEKDFESLRADPRWAELESVE